MDLSSFLTHGISNSHKKNRKSNEFNSSFRFGVINTLLLLLLISTAQTLVIPKNASKILDQSRSFSNLDPLTPRTRKLAAGGSHACVIQSDGRIYCWGSFRELLGQDMQIGGALDVGIPTRLFKDSKFEEQNDLKFNLKTTAKQHTIALDTNGTVWAVGTNSLGQLGVPELLNVSSPVRVYTGGDLNGKRIVDAKACPTHTLLLDDQGEVFSFGDNTAGALGIGLDDTVLSHSFVPKLISLTGQLQSKRIVQIDCGMSTGYAVDVDGAPMSWGYNHWGQLGSGTQTDRNKAGLVSVSTGSSLANKKVKLLRAGVDHVLALDTDGMLHAWGSNYNGALGTGSSGGMETKPVAVKIQGTALVGKKIVDIFAGEAFSFAFDDDGSLYHWGWGQVSARGYVQSTATAWSASNITASVLFGKKLVDLAWGKSSAYAIDNKGTMYSWGSNLNMELGDGTTKEKMIPVVVHCREGYTGESCDVKSCYDVPIDDPGVCSGNGKCLDSNICQCPPGYFAKDCSLFYCWNILWNETGKVCNFGKGKCVSADKCECLAPKEYYGANCDQKTFEKLFSETMDIATEFFIIPLAKLGLLFLLIMMFGVIVAVFILCILCVSVTMIGICVGGIFVIAKIIKNRYEKEKKEIFQKLLEGGEGELKDRENLDMSIFNLDFKDYNIIQELTSGGSGALCMEAMDKRNDEDVFIKLFVVNKNEDTNEWDVQQFKNEINLFLRLRHPNIVTFFGLFFTPPSRVGYVCEFCKNGTVHGFIKKLKKKKENNSDFGLEKKLDWLIQIGEGMRYLHQKDVIFRDLKPENILIDKKENLKLTDFGISKLVSDKNKANNTKLAGTPYYMAPEVARGTEYDNKVDVYSYAIVMFEILFETVEPFGEQNSGKYGIEFNVSENPDFRPKIDYSFFDEELSKRNDISLKQSVVQGLMNLMIKCWDHNPAQRPGFRQIVSELKNIQDLLGLLLEKDQ